MNISDRSNLKFEEKVRKNFTFLKDLGFSEVEALPTLMRYRNDDIEVDVYHGRQSYEIGAGVTAFGNRYELSEIIRVSDAEVAKQFRRFSSTTPGGLAQGLEKLSALMNHYARAALGGDQQFFSVLEKQRKLWSEEFALDVLAKKLRPQANEAFRHGDYSTAADLYSRILDRLSPAEIEKMNFAIRKSESSITR
ncbi:MAG: hypothetical protein WAW41_11195 [Methylobacter sp.]